jgi:hypothetical protein
VLSDFPIALSSFISDQLNFHEARRSKHTLPYMVCRNPTQRERCLKVIWMLIYCQHMSKTIEGTPVAPVPAAVFAAHHVPSLTHDRNRRVGQKPASLVKLCSHFNIGRDYDDKFTGSHIVSFQSLVSSKVWSPRLKNYLPVTEVAACAV